MFGFVFNCSVGVQQRRCVDVRVAMDLAVAQELRVLQTLVSDRRIALLLREPQVILKSDHSSNYPRADSSCRSCTHGIRAYVPCADRSRPDRLHRAEPQRVAAAPRDFFNRQAGFEVRGLICRDVRFDCLRLSSNARNEEPVVLRADYIGQFR